MTDPAPLDHVVPAREFVRLWTPELRRRRGGLGRRPASVRALMATPAGNPVLTVVRPQANHRAMDTPVESFKIELEDISGKSWWASILTTLASQNGNTQLRFVCRVNGKRLYKSSFLPCPRNDDRVPPQEAWAPGMTQSLQDLCRELEGDGWARASLGSEPWAFIYERPTTASL